MKLGATETIKFKKLSTFLGLSHWEAVGLLESIWMFTARNAPEGDIGRHSNDDIAGAIGWSRTSCDELIDVLIKCRWLDTDNTVRLIVHDWHEHMPNWLAGNLARHKKSQATKPKSQPTSQVANSTSQVTTQVTTQVTKPESQATTQPAKSSAQRSSYSIQFNSIHTNPIPDAGEQETFSENQTCGNQFPVVEHSTVTSSKELIPPEVFDASIPNDQLQRQADALCGFPPRSSRAEEFFSAYPLKIKKGLIVEAYERAIAKIVLSGKTDDDAHTLLMTKVREFSASPAGRPGTPESDYRVSPAKWLDQECWSDDPATWEKPNGGGPPKSAEPNQPKVAPINKPKRGLL